MTAHRDLHRARVLAELRHVAAREREFLAAFEHRYGPNDRRTRRQRALLLNTTSRIAQLEGGETVTARVSS